MEVILRHKNVDYWAGISKYKDCYDYISSYFTRAGNKYTGLTDDEAKRLEKALGFDEGTLMPSSPYWKTFSVKLGAKEKILHTENPWDELQYLFLRSHKRVANGLAEVRPNKDYVLINKESEAQESNRLNKLKRNAIKEFDKMSLEDMRKCLRLYGYKSDTMSAELVESKLYSLVEDNPNKFFTKWVNNKSRSTEVIIESALAKNILRKSKNVYYYGTDIIGSSLADTIAYLDDPKNQDLKLTITQELESK